VVSEKKLKGDASDRRVIMHVDFDCFFIAAGLIGRPELKGKPLAVCHAKVTDSAKANGSTSEIASCSYEARAFGVRNGQTYVSIYALDLDTGDS
jgi:DNA repair protein REV1